jgi:hypothetical protein
MKAQILGSLFLLGVSSVAYGQQANCEAALQYDVTAISQNVIAKISVLNTVNSSNYEESKQKFGVSIPGYFGGSFSDFSSKRQSLVSSLSSQRATYSQSNFFQRLLSPAGAKAFSECVAQQSNALVTAWISSGQRTDYVTVTIKKNSAGSGNINFTVTAIDGVVQQGQSGTTQTLSTNSTQTLLFKSPKSAQFLIVINATDAGSGASGSVTVEMPPYVEYRMQRSFQSLTAIGMCGAGGNGSTAGSPMRSNANFAAPAGYALDPSSVHLVKREKPSGWQYGLARDPQFTWTRLPEDAEFPRTMVGTPGPCEGENGHTQGRVDFTWEIQAFIDTAVLVP